MAMNDASRIYENGCQPERWRIGQKGYRVYAGRLEEWDFVGLGDNDLPVFVKDGLRAPWEAVFVPDIAQAWRAKEIEAHSYIAYWADKAAEAREHLKYTETKVRHYVEMATKARIESVSQETMVAIEG